jgi:WD40 repeat protein
MGTLNLLDLPVAAEGHEGEVYGAAYSPEGGLLLTAGWDGWLRLWDAQTGSHVHGFRAAGKPLASCAVSPDGKNYLSGSMEGLLGIWDAGTCQVSQTFVAHTRPVSCIRYAPDGKQLATSSWDRLVTLRKVGKEREGTNLTGHQDIVAGCRYSADGQQLLSWSHDGTVRLWDLVTGRESAILRGHDDRVTAAAISPDGAWVASGGRDGLLKLWDTATGNEVASLPLPAEICGCFFLLDGLSLVAVHVDGGAVLLGLSLEVLQEVQVGVRVQCAELAPSGRQLAVGAADGRPRLLEVGGLEQAALLVTATKRHKQDAGLLGRLLGRPRMTCTYAYSCPICRYAAELKSLPTTPFACARCGQSLRFASRLQFQTA